MYLHLRAVKYFRLELNSFICPSAHHSSIWPMMWFAFYFEITNIKHASVNINRPLVGPEFCAVWNYVSWVMLRNPPLRRYSSGCALPSWTICLHSSLFIYPSEANYLVSKQFSFYGMKLWASHTTPNLEEQDVPLRLAPSRWSVRHGWP
jgi:hypothetical protein